METIEGNKIIAEFVEWQHHSDSDYDKHEMSNLKYHSSWDWLMPVVEKIRSLWNENSLDLQLLEEDSDASRILYQRLWTPIESAWLAVVEFIEWYNQNK